MRADTRAGTIKKQYAFSLPSSQRINAYSETFK